jgi:hypothetical protein
MPLHKIGVVRERDMVFAVFVEATEMVPSHMCLGRIHVHSNSG